MGHFYRDIARWYHRFFPLAERKILFFEKLLEDEGAEAVLDLACGPGELTRALNRRGFAMTGVDDTAEFFESGSAPDPGGEDPVFCVARMEALPFRDEALFDTIICAGNSLPHLERISQIEDTIRSCSRLLRPGGIFCVQAIDFELVRARGTVALPELQFEEAAGRVCLRRFYSVDDEGAAFTPEVIIGDVFAHYRIPMCPLAYDGLWEMLRKSRFAHAGTYSDFRRAPWDRTSPSYITLARKAR